MKKTVFVALTATALLMSSCQSMNQFYGTATGASLGGMFGSAIGGMADGQQIGRQNDHSKIFQLRLNLPAYAGVQRNQSDGLVCGQ